MRNTVIMFSVIMLLFQGVSFPQNRTIDSLKAVLQNATEDTTRLRLYLVRGETRDKKDKLSYAESALKLSDKILSSAIVGKQRQKILNQEGHALYLIASQYTNGSGTEWDKVIDYINNRLKFIEKSGNKKRIAETRSLIAYAHLQKNDSAGFLANAYKSLKIFSEIKDSASIVGWHIRLNYYYLSAGNLSKAFDEIQSALKVARELNYTEGIGISLQQLGDMYRDNGEDAGAMENYNKALAIFQKTKDTVGLYNITGAIAGFYYTRHMTSKAIDYYNKMFAFSHSLEDAMHKTASIYKWMGMVYKDDNAHTNALLNLQKSLSAFTSLNDKAERKEVLDEAGSVYNNQGDLEKAIDYHNRSLNLADSLHWLAGKARSEYLLALDYYAKKDYTAARAHNDRALSSLRMQFDIKPTSEAALLASRIDSATRDGNSAYTHYKEYILLTNKIKGEEIRKEAQKESFQNELTRKNIQQEKKDIETKRIKNAQYLAIGVLAVVVLVVSLIVSILHKNNKSKQKANIALHQEKEKVERMLSELKLTQAQLVQSEKMASLGELTAGIAHEIQNPLNFVNNFSEVSTELANEMEEALQQDDKEEAIAIASDIKNNLQKIHHHGKRADAIVKGMLEHSRTSKGEKQPTDINALADEYLRLAYHGLRAKDKGFNSNFTTDFDESIGKIEVVPQDIGRVLLNLYNNAFYSVNEKKKQLNGTFEPTVEVTTKRVGDKVELCVKDNGTGIPQKVLDKIYQPFFTTKPTGQGTGLGLSLSYDIIKAHGGEMKAEAEEGEGAAFIITLPLLPK
jgi:two-component system, NtrC family, sensor kinase